MKVWELMAELGKRTANAEVRLQLSGANETELLEVFDDGDNIIIVGGEVTMCDSDGTPEKGALGRYLDSLNL